MAQTLGLTWQQLRDAFASRLSGNTPAGTRIDQERHVKLDENETFPRILIYVIDTQLQNDMTYGAEFCGLRRTTVKLEYHIDANDDAAAKANIDVAQTILSLLLSDQTFLNLFQKVQQVTTRIGADDTSARFRAAAQLNFTVIEEIGYGP